MKSKIFLYLLLPIAAAVYSCSSAQPKGSSNNTTTTSEKTFGKIALQESTVPIRPGEPGKAPFWNIAAKRFIYAPAFDFKIVPNAAKYKFEVTSELDNSKHEFESAVPYAPLSPVWAAVPVGYFNIKVSAVSATGNILATAGEGRYYRAAPFNGIYHEPPVMSYDESAMTALDKLMHKDFIEYWLTHKVPDPKYNLYRYPTKIYSALIIGALTYGKLKPTEQERSVKLARTIADFLISISMPKGNPYEYFPPSYYGYEEHFKTSNKKINTNSIMTIICADAGNAYLDLYDVTKDQKYLDAAKHIAETYTITQMENGSWYLFVDRESGKPTAANIAIPTSTINYFDRLTKSYGVKGLEAANKKALNFIMNNPVKTFDWHGQFEDIYERPPYQNLSREQACDLAIYLFRNSKDNSGNIKLAEELVRFSEDQFVIWEKPRPDLVIGKEGQGAMSKNWITPSVQEQYVYWMPVGRAAGIMVTTFWEAYNATKNEMYLAKAKSIANTFTVIQKLHEGDYPTYFTSYKMNYWLNSNVYPAKVLMELENNIKKIK
jgi:maltose/maltodextrin transport system substrate-binding protein